MSLLFRMKGEGKMKTRTFATPLQVLDAHLKPWAYNYESWSKIIYVTKGNVEFIKEKMNESGFSYIDVKPME